MYLFWGDRSWSTFNFYHPVIDSWFKLRPTLGDPGPCSPVELGSTSDTQYLDKVRLQKGKRTENDSIYVRRRFILQLFWQRRFIREDGLFSLFFVHHHLVVFSPFSTSNSCNFAFFRVPQSTAKNSRSTAINIRSMEINRGSTVCPRFIHGLSMVCPRFRWDVSVWNSWEYERVLKGQKNSG